MQSVCKFKLEEHSICSYCWNQLLFSVSLVESNVRLPVASVEDQVVSPDSGIFK